VASLASRPMPKPRASLLEWVKASPSQGPVRCWVCKHAKAKAWCLDAIKAMREARVQVSVARIAERMRADTGLALSVGAMRGHLIHHVPEWVALTEEIRG